MQDGITATGLRFAYVDTVLHNGSMLEIIEADAGTRDAFEYMKETARHWDGSDPLRS